MLLPRQFNGAIIVMWLLLCILYIIVYIIVIVVMTVIKFGAWSVTDLNLQCLPACNVWPAQMPI